MCSINGRYFKSETVEGYKVALKVKNHYYSPVTGIEYKMGPVKAVKKYGVCI
jgi:hypothetical protein